MADSIEVNIRMYRVGELGDCFLLTFTEGGNESNVLIDCGSFRNNSNSARRMQEIAAHIQAWLNRDQLTQRTLNVVIGTHQHNDHLSGFVHAKDTFEQLIKGQVWLSWLDNPADVQAAQVAEGQRKLAVNLQLIASELSKAVGLKKTRAATRINDLLGFYSLSAKAGSGDPIVPKLGVENLKAMGQAHYLEPGKVLELPGLAPGLVKVYVLGPPRDCQMLYDIRPGKNETYDSHLAAATRMAEDMLSALTNYSIGDPKPDEPFFPFDKRFEIARERPEGGPGEREPSYCFLDSSYNHDKKAWRKIDDEWLDQAERLALYLDSYTNNSSLVLAFELAGLKKALLFVGDAQTGNWLSWKSVKWENNGFSLDDMLSRTVLYKVGHHGSHNATLPEFLEKMTHPELVAMIPVDVSDPNIKRKVNGWKMPAANLYNRIKTITKGRIIRMDCQYDDCGPHMIDAASHWGTLLDNVYTDADGLFVEYRVKG